MSQVQIIERRDRKIAGGWYATVDVAGVRYFVGVEAGHRIRIPYKPRGPSGWGYQWHGFVRDAQGREVWSGRVSKSNGIRGLLKFAGLLPSAVSDA